MLNVKIRIETEIHILLFRLLLIGKDGVGIAPSFPTRLRISLLHMMHGLMLAEVERNNGGT